MKKDKNLHIRLTVKQLETLKIRAFQAGFTVSGYVVSKLIDGSVNAGNMANNAMK